MWREVDVGAGCDPSMTYEMLPSTDPEGAVKHNTLNTTKTR